MNRSRTTVMADHLRTQIAEGTIPPGQKLPSEAQLIAEHGVSRTVVREALGRLQAEGLIHTRRGAGSYALTPPAEVPPAARPVRTVEDRLHLIGFRLALETEIAGLAAEHRSQAQLASLHDELKAFSAAEGNPAQAMQHDFGFHRLLAEAARNPFLLDTLDGLGTTMITMPRTRITATPRPEDGSAGTTGPEEPAAGGVTPPSLPAHSTHQQATWEHGQILAAVAGCDPRAAAAAMRSHLTASRTRLLRDAGT